MPTTASTTPDQTRPREDIGFSSRAQKPNRLRSSDGTLSINSSISSFLPLRGTGELLDAAVLAAGTVAGADGFGSVDRGCGSGLSRLTSSVGTASRAWVGTACQRPASDLARLSSAAVILVSR